MPHDRGEPQRRLHVVAEDEEAGAERAQAVQREAVDDRAHAVLADAEVEVAARRSRPSRRCRRRRSASASRARGRRSRRPAPAPAPAAHWMTSWDALRVAIMPASGPFLGTSASQPSGSSRARIALELGGLVGELGAVGLEALAPRRLELLAARRSLARKCSSASSGDEERLQARVAVDLLRELDLLVAERRAVRAVRVLLVRRARARCACGRRSALGLSVTAWASASASSMRSRSMSSPRFCTCQP